MIYIEKTCVLLLCLATFGCGSMRSPNTASGTWRAIMTSTTAQAGQQGEQAVLLVVLQQKGTTLTATVNSVSQQLSCFQTVALTGTSLKGNVMLPGNVPPGKYELRANASSYQPASRVLEVQAGATAQSDMALQPLVAEPSGPSFGRTVPTLETGNNGGSLVGQVIDASTRRPIVGAMVSISKAQQTRTDDNGRFIFENLSPGRYQLTVWKPAYSSIQGVVSIQAARTAYANLSLQKKSDRAF